MHRKLIGYLKDGIDRQDYLSIEIPVFESTKKDNEGNGALQIIDKKTGLVKEFNEEVPEESIEKISGQLHKTVFAAIGGEHVYLTKYNNSFFAEGKTFFVSKLSRWISDKQLTFLNQFSIYLLFNVRYKVYWAVSEIIARNELNLSQLTIQNFSIPMPLLIERSSLSLKDIMLFYARLTMSEKTQLKFNWLFESSTLDSVTQALNEANYLVMGNYSIEANKLLSDLIDLNPTLGLSEEDHLVKRFQRCFLVLFGLLQSDQLESGQLIEQLEEKAISKSSQADVLAFNQNKVSKLITSLNIKWVEGRAPANCRVCAALESHFY